MPYYKPVFDKIKEQGGDEAVRRLARRLLKLKRQLEKEIPRRNTNDSLLLATWNLREFGKNEKYGIRSESSLLCIAEIISHFDLVAVQEVHQNMEDLKKLLYYVGYWWDYLVTDVTPGQAGNEERMAFLYDTRKIRFDHLAGEVVLADGKRPVRQLSRSPFICAFRSGWRRLSLCSVHIYYGSAVANEKRRVAEIDALARLLAKRNRMRQNAADGEPEAVVLLGDFNIFHKQGDETSEALERHDFVVPHQIRRVEGGSNLKRNRHYDQIAFHDPGKKLKDIKAGVFEFTKSVFAKDAGEEYDWDMRQTSADKYEDAQDKAKFYAGWRTFQISDHFPLWIELKTDFSEGYLVTCAGYVKRGTSKRPRKSR